MSNRDPGVLSKEVVVLDEQVRVLRMNRSGYSVREIHEETGLAQARVREILKDIRYVLTEQYLAEVETVRAVANSRLNKLYTVAEAIALGDATLQIGTLKPIFTNVLPDPKWAKVAIEIIKTQLDLMKFDDAAVRKREEDGQRMNYTKIEHMTINTGGQDNLYNTANEALQESWMDTGQAAILADQNIYDMIIEAADEAQIEEMGADPQLQALEKRVEKMSEHLPEEEE